MKKTNFKILNILLLLFLVVGLVGCSDNTKTNPEEPNQTETTVVEDKKEEEVTESIENNEVANDETASTETGPIDVTTAIVDVDSLSLEERYKWYAERYGTAFTDSAHIVEEYDLIKFIAYPGVPCELLELFILSTKDFVSYYTETLADGTRVAGDPLVLRKSCTP